MVVKFVVVIHFTVNGFEPGMQNLMMAWLCKNISQKSDYCFTYHKSI